MTNDINGMLTSLRKSR